MTEMKKHKVLMVLAMAALLAVGIVGIVVNSWLYNRFKSYGLTSSKYFQSTSVAIGVTVLLSLLDVLLGIVCLRLEKSMTQLILRFMFCLISLVLLALTVGLTILLFQRDLMITRPKEFVREFVATLENKDLVDFLQIFCQCCGYDSYKDYSLSIPMSCCRKTPCEKGDVFGEGCSTKIEKVMGRIQLFYNLAVPTVGMIIVAPLMISGAGVILCGLH